MSEHDYEKTLIKNKEKYSKHYNYNSLWEKLKSIATKGGTTVVYAALLLFEVMRDEHIPLRAKAIIIAALGYLILPVDLIPDVAPILGLTDDLGVLIYALSQIRSYLTPTIRERAVEVMLKLFPNISQKEVDRLQKTVF